MEGLASGLPEAFLPSARKSDRVIIFSCVGVSPEFSSSERVREQGSFTAPRASFAVTTTAHSRAQSSTTEGSTAACLGEATKKRLPKRRMYFSSSSPLEAALRNVLTAPRRFRAKNAIRASLQGGRHMGTISPSFTPSFLKARAYISLSDCRRASVSSSSWQREIMRDLFRRERISRYS